VAWTWCECGCGWSGVDDVTQFCVEEAAFWSVEKEDAPSGVESELVEPSPGDPALAAAQAQMAAFARGDR
jgi:hypothetical protein